MTAYMRSDSSDALNEEALKLLERFFTAVLKSAAEQAWHFDREMMHRLGKATVEFSCQVGEVTLAYHQVILEEIQTFVLSQLADDGDLMKLTLNGRKVLDDLADYFGKRTYYVFAYLALERAQGDRFFKEGLASVLRGKVKEAFKESGCSVGELECAFYHLDGDDGKLLQCKVFKVEVLGEEYQS